MAEKDNIVAQMDSTTQIALRHQPGTHISLIKNLITRKQSIIQNTCKSGSVTKQLSGGARIIILNAW